MTASVKVGPFYAAKAHSIPKDYVSKPIIKPQLCAG